MIDQLSTAHSLQKWANQPKVRTRVWVHPGRVKWTAWKEPFILSCSLQFWGFFLQLIWCPSLMSNLTGNVITSLRRSNILRWLLIITFGLIWNVYIAPSAKKNQSSSQSRHWMSGQIPTCCYLFFDWLFLVLFIILKSYFTIVCVYFFVFRLNGLVYFIMWKKKKINLKVSHLKHYCFVIGMKHGKCIYTCIEVPALFMMTQL